MGLIDQKEGEAANWVTWRRWLRLHLSKLIAGLCRRRSHSMLAFSQARKAPSRYVQPPWCSPLTWCSPYSWRGAVERYR